MKINKIVINNYKSIKKLTIDIKKINGSFLRTLLGLNESGKSNILKAIFEMSDKTVINYEKDCFKDARRKGKPIIISTIYVLDENEKDLLEDIFLNSKIVHNNQTNKIDFIERRLTLNSNSEKILEWLPIIPEQGTKFMKKIEENVADGEKLSNEIDVSFEELKESIKENEEGSFLERNKPKVIYWKASPEYLITNPINLDSFKNDKDSNIPLKNLFNLMGISEENLDSLIERVKGDDAERRQVSKEISEKATKYINDVWPEHKISFEIWIESNSNCFVHIMDNDNNELFRMDERSDGFKQFVSILLTLSAEFRNKLKENNIILIDEPEINLHPSSIQYLRDELMKIAKENYLIIASHSIFIVDKKSLGRHIKVFKEQGETKIEIISEDNPFAEEIIYRALGTSIYEIIEPYVLVFEGSTDKELYDAFVMKFKGEVDISKLKTISATGVKEVRKYLKFFNQKTVTGIVLLDSDKAGREVLRAIKENDNNFEKSSFEISNFSDLNKSEITLEDLLPIELIKETFFEIYDTELINLDETKPIIQQIKEFKAENGLTGDFNLKEFKIKLIRKILSDMVKSKEDIKKKYAIYFRFFEELNKKINEVQSIPR